jgi:hypothetical protein
MPNRSSACRYSKSAGGDEMRLVATEYVSVDGVMDEPGKWSFPFWT